MFVVVIEVMILIVYVGEVLWLVVWQVGIVEVEYEEVVGVVCVLWVDVVGYCGEKVVVVGDKQCVYCVVVVYYVGVECYVFDFGWDCFG